MGGKWMGRTEVKRERELERVEKAVVDVGGGVGRRLRRWERRVRRT
jgi:hypothetical protein